MKRTFIYLLLIFLSLHAKSQESINDFEELANGYFNQGKTTQAAEFYNKAGYAYWNRGNNTKAINAFQKSYDIFSGQGNIKASIAVGNNLGLIYLDEEKYANARTAFVNVLAFARKTKNTLDIYNSLINVGTVAFELSSYSEAIAHTSEALVLAKEMSSLKALAKCYSLLAESYDKINDATNAYKYFELYSSIDKKIKAQEIEDVKQTSAEEIGRAHETKRITEIELKIKKGELKLTQDSLGVAERLAYERQMQVELRNEQLKKKEIQLRYELHLRRTLITGMIIVGIFLIILAYFLWQKLRDNKTLKLQKKEITLQRNTLDIQNKKITDSIYYGLRIQQAMLPDLNELYKRFEAFVIYRPKDIVSGDFYWFYEQKTENTITQFIALADCTGHGVPGAFMSMIGHRLLTEIVVGRQTHQPSQVLEAINTSLRKELDQDNKQSVDGMDISFCKIIMINGEYEEIVFAGAKRPVMIYKQDEKLLTIIDGDRKGIGGIQSQGNKAFTDKTIKINRGDSIFLYSDGIIDQQNTQRDRFGTTRFSKVINENMNGPMTNIKAAIENTFDAYMKPEEQRDDVTIIGLKLS